MLMKPILYLHLAIIGCVHLSACTRAPENFIDPNTPRYARTDFIAPSHNAATTIRVISFNTDEGQATKDLLAILKNNKKLEHADILCLQEMDRKSVEWLAEVLQYNYVYYPSAVHPRHRKDFGSAILTPWPIEEDHKILLPFAMDDKFIKMNRAAVSARIQIHGQPVLVYSVHLGVILSPQNRAEQAHTIINSIPADTKTCVIAGDFNTYAFMHVAAVLEEFNKARFTRATAGAGWTYKYWYLLNRKSTLDHIFIRGGEVIKAERISDRTVSDHRPLWVEFKI